MSDEIEQEFTAIFERGLNDERLRRFLNTITPGHELYLHGGTKRAGEFAGIPVHTNPAIPPGRIFAINPGFLDPFPESPA